jgi:hypothetical protein
LENSQLAYNYDEDRASNFVYDDDIEYEESADYSNSTLAETQTL